MPGEGHLTVTGRETSRGRVGTVPDGVRITVSDIGRGMDDEAVARAFEPNFLDQGNGDRVGAADREAQCGVERGLDRDQQRAPPRRDLRDRAAGDDPRKSRVSTALETQPEGCGRCSRALSETQELKQIVSEDNRPHELLLGNLVGMCQVIAH